jgi:hypothetical protein
MTRRLLLALAIWCASALPVVAQSIDRYVETVIVDEMGNGQVSATLALPAGWDTPVTLPVAAGPPSGLSVRSGAGETASTETRDGQTWIVLTPARPSSAPTTIELAWESAQVIDMARAPLAHGVRRARFAFVNTTGAAIDSIERTLVLPEGFVVSSVDDVVPAATESTVGPAYELGPRDGSTGVTVRAKALPIGGTIEATIRFKPRASPVPLLGVLALVAAVYLYRFRDLVARATPAGPSPHAAA